MSCSDELGQVLVEQVGRESGKFYLAVIAICSAGECYSKHVADECGIFSICGVEVAYLHQDYRVGVFGFQFIVGCEGVGGFLTCKQILHRFVGFYFGGLFCASFSYALCHIYHIFAGLRSEGCGRFDHICGQVVTRNSADGRQHFIVGGCWAYPTTAQCAAFGIDYTAHDVSKNQILIVSICTSTLKPRLVLVKAKHH